MSATTPMSYHSHVPLRRPWAWPVHPPFKPRLSQTQENPPTSTQENGKCGWGLWWISWKVRKWGKCQRRCCFSFCLSRYCSCSSCWFFLLYAQISCGVGCFGWLDRILRCGPAVFELLSAESYFAWPVQVQEASAAYLCAKTAQKWQWWRVAKPLAPENGKGFRIPEWRFTGAHLNSKVSEETAGKVLS